MQFIIEKLFSVRNKKFHKHKKTAKKVKRGASISGVLVVDERRCEDNLSGRDPKGVIIIIAAGEGSRATETRGNGHPLINNPGWVE